MALDWGTITTSVVGSGIVGGGVSYLIATRESKDRQAVHALEREKWEHQRTTDLRERSRVAVSHAKARAEALREDFIPLMTRVRDHPVSFVSDASDEEVIKRMLALTATRDGWAEVGNELFLLEHFDAEQAFTDLSKTFDESVDALAAWADSRVGECPSEDGFRRSYALLAVELQKVLKNV